MGKVERAAILLFWLFYNTAVVFGVLAWSKANVVEYGLAFVPIVFFTALMMAITIGNQNKDKE